MPNRQGFTLVELSIVLVIIGLLIGGILAAQSMIQTARIQSVIRQISQYDIAVTNFQTRYDALPGDAAPFGGNGNGWIEPNGNFFTGEAANVWIDLQQSGFMAGNAKFSTTVPAGGFNSDANAPNAPELKVGSNPQVIVFGQATIFGDGTVHMPYYAFYQIADWHGSDPSSTSGGVVKPAVNVDQAFAIDLKLDDGNPGTGIIQTRLGFSTGIDAGATCDDFDYAHLSTATYLTGSNTNCFLAVGMQNQVLNQPFMTR